MIRETYKGRKLQITKGREFGYARITLNGVCLGDHIGCEEDARRYIVNQIDYIDQEPVNGDRWTAEWYAPGTFEVCENGHPKTPESECEHTYCKRNAA